MYEKRKGQAMAGSHAKSPQEMMDVYRVGFVSEVDLVLVRSYRMWL